MTDAPDYYKRLSGTVVAPGQALVTESAADDPATWTVNYAGATPKVHPPVSGSSELTEGQVLSWFVVQADPVMPERFLAAAGDAESVSAATGEATDTDVEESTSEADSGQSETDGDIPTDTRNDVAAQLQEAFEADGFDVQSLEDNGDEVAFNLRHESFDRLKEVTSECGLVGYNGEVNTIDKAVAGEYMREVLR